MSRQGAQPGSLWPDNAPSQYEGGHQRRSGLQGTSSETPSDDFFAGPFYTGPKFYQPPPSSAASARLEESPVQTPAAGGRAGPGLGFLGPLGPDRYRSAEKAANPSGARRSLFEPLDPLHGTGGGGQVLPGPDPRGQPSMGFLGQDFYAAAPAAQPWGLAEDQEMEADSDLPDDAVGLPLPRQEWPEPRRASGFGFGGPAGGFAGPGAGAKEGPAPFFLPFGGPPAQSGLSGPSNSGFSSTVKPPRPEGMQDLIRAKRKSNDSGLPHGPQSGPLSGPGCFASPFQTPSSIFSCPGGAAGSVCTSPDTSPPRGQIIGLVGPPSIKEQHRQAESSRMKALSLPTPNAGRATGFGVGWASAGPDGRGGGDAMFDTGSSAAAIASSGRGAAFSAPGGGETDPGSSHDLRLIIPQGGPMQLAAARARGPRELGWAAAPGPDQAPAPPFPGMGAARGGGSQSHVVGANRRIQF